MLEGKVYCPPTNKTQRIWIPLPVLSEGSALEYLKISNDGKYYSKFPKTDGRSKGRRSPPLLEPNACFQEAQSPGGGGGGGGRRNESGKLRTTRTEGQEVRVRPKPCGSYANHPAGDAEA